VYSVRNHLNLVVCQQVSLEISPLVGGNEGGFSFLRLDMTRLAPDSVRVAIEKAVVGSLQGVNREQS
jgi:hypothetical protein